MKKVITTLLVLGQIQIGFAQINPGGVDIGGDGNNGNAGSDLSDLPTQSNLGPYQPVTGSVQALSMDHSGLRDVTNMVTEALNELHSFNHGRSGYTNYTRNIENPDPTRCWYDSSGVFNPYLYNPTSGCSEAQRKAMVTSGLERLQEMKANGEIRDSLAVYERLHRNLVERDMGFEAVVKQETAEMMAHMANRIFNAFRETFKNITGHYPNDNGGQHFTRQTYNQTWQQLFPVMEQEFRNTMQLDRDLVLGILDFGAKITENNQPWAVQSMLQNMYPHVDANGVRHPASANTPAEVNWLKEELQQMANQLVYDRIEYLRNLSRGGEVGTLRQARTADRPVSEQRDEFESMNELKNYMAEGFGTPHAESSLGARIGLNTPLGNATIGSGTIRTGKETFKATATIGAEISGPVGGGVGVEFTTSVDINSTNTVQGGVVFLEGSTGQLFRPGNGVIRQSQGNPVFFACSYSGAGNAGTSATFGGRVFGKAKYFGNSIEDSASAEISRGTYDYAARDKRSGFIRVPLRIAGRLTTVKMLADFCKRTFSQATIKTPCGRETTLPDIVERDLKVQAREGRLRVVEPDSKDKVACRVDGDCRRWRDGLRFGFSSYAYECALDMDTGDSLICQFRANSGANCSTEDDNKYVNGIWSPFCSRNQICQRTGNYRGVFGSSDRDEFDENWTCVDP